MAESKTKQRHYTTDELRSLYKKADEFNKNTRGPEFNNVQWLYRNSMRSCWEDDIKKGNRGVIPLKVKNEGGDPKCPINGKLDGIFFFANVISYIGTLPANSPYGDTRWKLPISRAFEELKQSGPSQASNSHGDGDDAAGLDTKMKSLGIATSKQNTPNLYFADFYCMPKNTSHYVVLVLTKSGSKADKFCSRKLVPMDFQHNPFFRAEGSEFKVTGKTWVEVFYTEELRLDMGEFDEQTYQEGASKPSGLPKNPDCSTCNSNL